MSPLVAVTTGAGHNQRAAEAWEAIRADGSIQYAPIEVPEQSPPPGWLVSLFEALAELLAPVGRLLGLSWPVFKWVLLALAVLLIVVLLWRLLAPALGRRRARSEPAEDAWLPARDEALALLEDADRLAAEGRFDEATHLLLQRSVSQIAAVRPDWVEPSSTARELTALAGLPEAARSAFATIAERVERSLFALRQLGAEDWQAARSAYAEFALQALPDRGA